MKCLAAGFFSALILGACAETASYTGTGTFTDRGAKDANRYEINFGNLSGERVNLFTVSNSPTERFVFGLRSNTSLTQSELDNTVVSIEITDVKGVSMVKRSEPLARWVRSSTSNDESRAFFYLRDPRGTYVDLQKSETYAVKVLVSGAAKSPEQLEFVAMGGGWK
jgi:hypothetical protein